MESKSKKLPKKPPSVSVLKKKADSVFSLYIRQRDAEWVNGEWQCTCITCGVMKPLKQMQNGHFVSRRCTSLRYDEQNCNAQCYQCNVMEHGMQYQYALALDDKYGEGTADRLFRQRFQSHKLTISELEDIITTAKLNTMRLQIESL